MRFHRTQSPLPPGVLLGAALLALWLLACASAPPPPPVPVAGETAALAAMAGEWRGEYWSADTGRRGTIRFTLDAAGVDAHGDVWMYPVEPHRPTVGNEAPGESHAVQPVEIRFVKVSGGGVRGKLEPYRDPGCGCTVSTTFEGTVDGDRIEGTYTTSAGLLHRTTTGNWEVDRIEARAAGG